MMFSLGVFEDSLVDRCHTSLDIYYRIHRHKRTLFNEDVDDGDDDVDGEDDGDDDDEACAALCALWDSKVIERNVSSR